MVDASSPTLSRGFSSNSILKSTGLLWFLVAVLGQWLFAYYVIAAYGPPTASGDWSNWDDVGLIQGFTAGDLVGNLTFVSHALLTAIVCVGGTMQLMPPIRNRFPAIHRFTGRVYLLVAVVMAVGGIWMIWGRGSRLTDIGGWGTTINGVLVLISALVAFHFARHRRIDQHRRWAMRTFILLSGVWFTRLGYMSWAIATGGLGMSRSLDGPFDMFIAFGSYLLPLAILEIYFLASESRSSGMKLVVSGLMLAATGATALGVFGAWMMMWSPQI
ncbi:MAG: membrane protein [Hyphobacterium sp.]|nr:MAG: membrane protein [Hyphobacterium sp.]